MAKRPNPPRKNPEAWLTPEQTLAVLQEHFRFSYDTLAEATYEVEVEGKKKRQLVFGGRKRDTLRKLFDDKYADIKWRHEYAAPLVAWLRVSLNLDIPDLFLRSRTRDELSAILTRNHAHSWEVPKLRQLPRYKTIDQNTIALILDRMMASRSDPTYFERTVERPQGLIGADASELRHIVIERETLVPAPELSKLANIHLLCAGCGRGHEEHKLFADVYEAHWSRRGEIENDHASDPADYVGLAELVSRSVQSSMLDGDHKTAIERATVVDQWISSGNLGDRNTARVLRVKSRLAEPLSDTAFSDDDFVQATANAFGPTSEGYISALKCRACRAVSRDAKDADMMIEEARAVVSQIASGQPNQAEAMREHHLDLSFIELIHLERQHKSEPRRHDEALGRQVEELHQKRKQYRAPLRRAKLLQWLWRATGRSRRTLLEYALRLTAERPTVKSLCVFDVSNFRSELSNSLRDTK